MEKEEDDFDENINNYTVNELLEIIKFTPKQINDLSKITSSEIDQKTDVYIKYFSTTTHTNKKMVRFFKNIKKTLMEKLALYKSLPIAKYPPLSKDKIKLNQTVLPNTNITTSIHRGLDKDQHRNYQIGQSSQNTKNPNLTNNTILKQYVTLDSQYQTTVSPINNSNNYTAELFRPLTQLISFNLHSLSIPYTWYNIDSEYKNNIFWILFSKEQKIKVEIPSGQYSLDSFQQTLTDTLISIGFVFENSLPIPNKPVYINPLTNKLELNLYNSTNKYNNLVINENTIISFYDDSTSPVYSFKSLGWIMGFRVPYIYADKLGNKAPVIINLSGPKYLVISIDELHNSTLSTSFIGNTNSSNTNSIKLPDYYINNKESIPITIVDNSTQIQHYNTNLISDNTENTNTSAYVIDNLYTNPGLTPQIIPSEPRKLTQAQIYNVNEILKNNKKENMFRIEYPTINNVFAIIPVDTNGIQFGNIFSAHNSSLKHNMRVYTGPITLDKFKIKLYDDCGNLVNLNGGDWAMTLICDILHHIIE